VFVIPRWQMPFGSQQPSQLLGPQGGGTTTQLPPSHVVFGGQKMHWLPNDPHSWGLLTWQLPKGSQQPFGQVWGVQVCEGTQFPCWQARPGGHALHTLPPKPHSVGSPLPGWHPAPFGSQHPGHVAGPQGPVGVHAPPLQNVFGGHAVHALPPEPQSFCAPPPTQPMTGSQQPPQLAGEQAPIWQLPPTHIPFCPQFWHCWPVFPHAFCVPFMMHMAPRQQPPAQFAGPQGVATHACAFGSQTAPADAQFSQD
jgi:hypothetical protein